MSVLVWDGQTLAADSYANGGNLAFPFPKVWQVQDISSPMLAGAVGPLQEVGQLRNWTTSTGSPQTFPILSPESQLVIVSKDKGLIRYNGSSIPLLHGHNKLAIGEGAPFAYGALYMGATAEQAVAAAIQYSPHCSGEPISLRLE